MATDRQDISDIAYYIEAGNVLSAVAMDSSRIETDTQESAS